MNQARYYRAPGKTQDGTSHNRVLTPEREVVREAILRVLDQFEETVSGWPTFKRDDVPLHEAEKLYTGHCRIHPDVEWPVRSSRESARDDTVTHIHRLAGGHSVETIELLDVDDVEQLGLAGGAR
jgi:hypothetical protein